MKRGLSPGILIGIVFLVVAALFAFLIGVAVKQPTPAPALPSSPLSTPPPTVPVDTLGKAPGTTSFSLDSLNDTSLAGSPPMPIAVMSGAAVTLRGWAVDVPNGAAAGGVIVSVDAVNYQAAYGADRPDVAALLGKPAYRPSGFSITFPAKMLTPGGHTITIKILTNDRKAYYQPDQTITIALGPSSAVAQSTASPNSVALPTAPPTAVTQPAAPPPIALPTSPSNIPFDTLTRLAGTTTYSIDSLNDTSLAQPPPAPIPVPATGSIILRGWAVDVRANGPASGVIVSVDEKTNVRATYGAERPDVAEALGNPADQPSGFSATLPASSFTPGKHTISIKILTSDGMSYYQPDQVVEIEIG